MWQTKYFMYSKYGDDCLNVAREWMARNQHKYQMDLIIVNNGYGVEYRKLRRIY